MFAGVERSNNVDFALHVGLFVHNAWISNHPKARANHRVLGQAIQNRLGAPLAAFGARNRGYLWPHERLHPVLSPAQGGANGLG